MAYEGEDTRFYQLRDAAFGDRKEAARLIAEDRTILRARSAIGETALHFLVVENAREAVEFLRTQGAEIDAENDYGDTPLVDAAGLGYLDMCRYLIGHGADFRHVNPENGNSVFNSAAQSDKVEVLRYLLGLLAPDEDIDPFVSDVDAELILSSQDEAAGLLRARGLRKRWSEG